MIWDMSRVSRSRRDPSCGCKGRDGRTKRCYGSASEAHEVADDLATAKGVCLRVYRCPRGYGYHLTSAPPVW